MAAREHSRQELRRKLGPHAESEHALEALLDDFQARGWLDERRFIESVIHRHATRAGSARLRQQLTAHGVDRDTVREVLAPLRESEFDRAWALWQRRFGTPPGDDRERLRQMRFLAARGFEPQVVRRVMDGAFEASAEEGDVCRDDPPDLPTD